MNKILISACIFIISLNLFSQTIIDVQNDLVQINPGFSYTDTDDILWKNKATPYNQSVIDYGLQFQNNTTNTLLMNMLKDNLNSSPVIGVHGEGTIVKYDEGTFTGDGGQAKASFALMNGGKFIIGKNAKIDLINESYFTRQFWIWSDGTGIFELEEGFIADLTEFGTEESGMGSIRLSKCNVITHSSESLPMGYRPNTTTGIADINSHFVFEDQDSTVWKIMTNDQIYDGGLWLDADLVIETIKNLEVSGEKTVTNHNPGGEYTNWGGVMMRNYVSSTKPEYPKTLTKRGSGKLILSGDHGYDSGSLILIEEGIIEFKSDPWTYHDNKYDITYKFGSAIDTPNLNIEIQNQAILHVNTNIFRVNSINCNNNTQIKTSVSNLIESEKLNANGDLFITLPPSSNFNSGNEYKIFNIKESLSGIFSNVSIDDLEGAISWDLSRLYSEGIVAVESGSGSTDVNSFVEAKIIVHPNPAMEYITVKSDLKFEKIEILDAMGMKIFETDMQYINIKSLSAGIYLIKINNQITKIVKL
jgi:hypothetical protein